MITSWAVPYAAEIAGGLAIGMATALLWWANGRIAGISGILGRAMFPESGEDRRWRLAFLLGLPMGAGLVFSLTDQRAVVLAGSPLGHVAAGLLVGFGTRLANGCTSGHGICGVSRGAPRSLVATGIFMAVAAATVCGMRHAAVLAP